ncbi:hypothetical protein F2P81_026064 [Scophthalmus maximus]|uniref:Uncharacterized protein n=1 Tax=Scophthalmus maximus TaxID=52904 RepID=A0A6A4RII4_SCOMX|nr:hypothetical protein F2P81_026064 [Scophthalmus maximus]
MSSRNCAGLVSVATTTSVSVGIETGRVTPTGPFHTISFNILSQQDAVVSGSSRPVTELWEQLLPPQRLRRSDKAALQQRLDGADGQGRTAQQRLQEQKDAGTVTIQITGKWQL